MFTGNKASKIATQYNGKVITHTTRNNQTVKAVAFGFFAFNDFVEAKQSITYKREKVNHDLYVIF